MPDNALELADDKKRKSVYTAAGDRNDTKRVKKEAPSALDAATLSDLKECDLSAMTVPRLKEISAQLGMLKGGKKADLIERIQYKLATM